MHSLLTQTFSPEEQGLKKVLPSICLGCTIPLENHVSTPLKVQKVIVSYQVQMHSIVCCPF